MPFVIRHTRTFIMYGRVTDASICLLRNTRTSYSPIVISRLEKTGEGWRRGRDTSKGNACTEKRTKSDDYGHIIRFPFCTTSHDVLY